MVLGAILRPVEKCFVWAAVLILLALVILTNVEVFGRYFIGYSTLIADEYGGYAYTWIVLLGGVHLLRSDGNLTMNLVVDRNLSLKKICQILAALTGTVCSAIFVYACWKTFMLSYAFESRSIQPSRTVLWIPQIILPVGFAVLTLAYLEDFLCRISGRPVRRAQDDKDLWGDEEH